MHFLVYEYKTALNTVKELTTPVEQMFKYIHHGEVSNHRVVPGAL